MRILFVCSDFEPGKGGVGDYTRLLAKACERSGDTCGVMALNDAFVNGDGAETDHIINTVRFARETPWNERCVAARAFTEAINPDWISLQFVPYGYEPRGVPWHLARHLRPLLGARSLHIMFHEIWIGAHQGASTKDRLIGWLQRVCISRLVQRLRPSLVHTSNVSYEALLSQHGIDSQLLPMFGTIPVLPKSASDWAFAEMRRMDNQMPRREDAWVFVIFGTLHPVWPPEPLFSYLRSAAERAGKQIIIASIGRLGSGEALWAQISSRYAPAIQFIRLGEQRAERVSEFLHTADFGIATSPWTLIGKSASVACMLDHGLPVIVNRDDIHFSGWQDEPRNSPLLLKMDENLPKRLSTIHRATPRASLPEVADTFLASLERQGYAEHL